MENNNLILLKETLVNLNKTYKETNNEDRKKAEEFLYQLGNINY